jgi:hypothetical protein
MTTIIQWPSKGANGDWIHHTSGIRAFIATAAAMARRPHCRWMLGVARRFLLDSVKMRIGDVL